MIIDKGQAQDKDKDKNSRSAKGREKKRKKKSSRQTGIVLGVGIAYSVRMLLLDGEHVTVEVPGYVYDKYEAGDCYNVEMYAGALGMRYYISGDYR